MAAIGNHGVDGTMPLLKINATGPDPRPENAANPARHGLEEAVGRALVRAPQGPVVILLHGYKYSPHHAICSPHNHILSLAPAPCGPKSVSWPRHLGFGRPLNAHREGLCIAFGWEARGHLWGAYRRAAAAGRALAELVRAIHRAAPQRLVDVVAHSLGARVFLSGLAHMPAAAMGRAILLSAAEMRTTAARAIDCPAGGRVEIFNITSRENDPYDFLFERLIAPLSPGARALGHGLGSELENGRENWLDIQMDCADALAALAGLGFRINPPLRRVCHWSAYLRPGMFPFYRALLRERARLPLPRLRTALPARGTARWSRLFARPTPFVPLPFGDKS